MINTIQVAIITSTSTLFAVVIAAIAHKGEWLIER